MKTDYTNIYLKILLVFLLILGAEASASELDSLEHLTKLKLDSPPPPPPSWESQDDGNIYTDDKAKGLNLGNPENIKEELQYNPETGKYELKQTVGGDFDYRNPTEMTLEEYLEYERKKSKEDFFKEQIAKENGTKSDQEEEEAVPEDMNFGFPVLGKGFDRILGGNTISINPQGSAEISLGVTSSKTDNPAIPVRQRKITTFDFDQRIQVNIVGNIGEKLKITTNYNTEASFDFENQVKIEYTGTEDEIVKKLEAGNVSLPLNSTLITGSQGLFGIKGQFQFGRLTATTIFSQQKSEKKSIEVAGGAQVSTYEIDADNYEANKHYFLSLDYRNDYDATIQRLPELPQGSMLNRIEVWVTNTTQKFEDTRNIIAFTDLGENPVTSSNPNGYTYRTFTSSQMPNSTLPDNNENDIYAAFKDDPNVRSFDNATLTLRQDQFFLNPPQPFEAAIDYEKIESARKLSSNEYSYNSRMGFISLNQSLNNDEVLAVAYEYTDKDGNVHQVGEFSTDGIDGKDALILKLLKGTLTNTELPLWDLMMKNIYNIGAYQVAQKNFALDIFFRNPETGVDINYIPENPVDDLPLLQTINFDRLNMNNTNSPDGFYDFIDGAATQGGTINSRNGRVFFPAVEPFGSHLEKRLLDKGVDPQIVARIVFKQLYDSTRTKAQQFPEFDRYSIKGRYESTSGSEISLNSINVPEGSVTVTAGGVPLTEGVDYTVDYTLGRVKIINAGLLESNTPIKVDFESNSLFSVQTKTLLGTNLDFEVNKDFHIGATYMRLSERPLTRKVNAGTEPVANNVVGVNAQYSTDAPWLTKATDLIPGISTNAESKINASGEFAYLIPGQPKSIGAGGVSYIDDFEASQSAIDIKSPNAWKIASVPQGQTDMFPEGELFNNLASGHNRALLSWYTIDPLFFRNNNLTPDNIRGNEEIQNDHYQREVYLSEIFPNKQVQSGTPTNVPTLDLAYYPDQRGPYNYSAEPSSVSAGVDPATGLLNNPESRWGGVQRALTTTDFELANIEYIQFWMMDPFDQDAEDNNHDGQGTFYINLGNVSEDVLRDDKKVFENGLPTTEQEALDISTISGSNWGRVPETQQLTNAFDNDPNTRPFQDAGLDGLIDQAEVQFHQSYSDWVSNNVAPGPNRDAILADISGDNYQYYLDANYDAQDADVIARYKSFNGTDGNSPAQSGDPETVSSATTLPDVEDINGDFVSNTSEQYYQYKIELDKDQMEIGKNFIVDKVEGVTGNSSIGNVYWYQFKIPITDHDRVVGSINDFRSIRFMRMFMKGFDKASVLRFAKLELIRGEWRRYDRSLEEPGEGIIQDPEDAFFALSAVNLEENGAREPIPYVVPPDIQREIQTGPTTIELNEQALELRICGLQDGDARAAFKNVNFDVRSYKKLEMFAHAEAIDPEILNDGDLTLYVRLGSDYNENYYEYELPLKVSTPFNGDPYNVWPVENNVEIEFNKFTNLKIQRNLSGTALFDVYSSQDGDRVYSIKGNPNFSEMQTIMIGVRNPSANGDSPWKPDDGQSKCGIIWVNELRLTDFDNNNGWATVGQVSANLGDFADIAVSGHMSTPGWGSIEQKVSDRQRETIKGYDAQTTVQVGKFLGEKAGLRLPLYFGYSEEVITPQFDPSTGDVLTSEVLSAMNPAEQTEHKSIIETKKTQRNINLSNVGFNPKTNGKKARFYDLSNIALSFAYSNSFYRDYFVENDETRTYRYGLAYNFNNNPKNIKPFSKSSKMKSPWLKIIRDFNFYLAPKSLGFTTNFNRTYNQKLLRPISDGAITTFQVQKQYLWNRDYIFNYDLAKNIKFTFSAQNVSLIGEPEGVVDKKLDLNQYQVTQDSIWSSIKQLGLNTRYQHQYNFKVKLPIDQIPAFKFMKASFNYGGTYQWQRMNLVKYAEQDSLNPNYVFNEIIKPKDYSGNTIENSRTVGWNLDMNFMSIYNKVDLFKKTNNKFRRRGSSSGKKSSGKNTSTQSKSKTDVNITVGDYFIKMLMMVKNVSGSFNITEGTFIPGYTETSSIMGMNPNWSAPGFNFIAGAQNYDIWGVRKDGSDIIYDLAEQGYIIRGDESDGTFINQRYSETHSTTLNLKTTLEPFPDLRIDLKLDQKYTENKQAFFRYVDDISDYGYLSPSVTGSYSSTFISIGSSFASSDKETYSSETFQKMLDDRVVISTQLGEEDPNSSLDTSQYYSYYGATSQDVLISSFISAYGNKSAKYYNPVKVMPLPNWRITYNGLAKIPSIKKVFRTFTLNHSYSSTYGVSNFTNILSDTLGAVDLNGNNWPKDGRQINTAIISEKFSPLISIDMETNNKILLKAEFKKDRNVTLSTSNNQITEVKGEEYVFGAGYRIPKVPFPFKTKNPIKSDLNLRGDVSVRNNYTIARKIVEETNQATAGQRIVSIKFSMDYMISQIIQLRFFYDQVLNKPVISNSFPTSNVSSGISIRFTLN